MTLKTELLTLNKPSRQHRLHACQQHNDGRRVNDATLEQNNVQLYNDDDAMMWPR
jgi:hypothetical protein